MIQHSNRRLAALFLASDLIATLVALGAAYWLRFDAEIIPVTKGVPAISSYLRLFPYIAVVWPVVFYFHRLYQIRRTAPASTRASPFSWPPRSRPFS